MKIIASMSVRDELDRYLRLTVPALLSWVDEIRVQDDHSTDGTFDYLDGLERVEVTRNTGSRWDENEGELHQQLLEWTLEGEPTHVLAIDADEWIHPEDGAHIRSTLAAYVHDRNRPAPLAYRLNMVELWTQEPPRVRVDHGWRPHPVGILWRVPPAAERTGVEWQIWGRKMAGGRVPRAIRSEDRKRKAVDLDLDIVHLGWSNPLERDRRHRRYAELDGGQFHAKAHLDSILWGDRKCDLRDYPADRLPALDLLT